MASMSGEVRIVGPVGMGTGGQLSFRLPERGSKVQAQSRGASERENDIQDRFFLHPFTQPVRPCWLTCRGVQEALGSGVRSAILRGL